MEKDKTSRITNFANVLLDALEMVAQKMQLCYAKGLCMNQRYQKSIEDKESYLCLKNH